MRSFTCPKHGDYDDEAYPIGVGNVACQGCLRERDPHVSRVQAEFDREYAIWLQWRYASGVPARGHNRTIENWRPLGKAQEAAGKTVRHWCARMREQLQRGVGLTLIGPPGVGKTHLGYGIIAVGAKLGIPGTYSVWSDATDSLKASFGNRSNDGRDAFEALKGARLLVLDEIGVRAGSEFDQALLFDLIDTRYRCQRATIVCTNLADTHLESIGERTADRLREANVSIVIPGQSRREQAASDLGLINSPPAVAEPTPPAIPFEVSINGALVSRPICPKVRA